MSKFGLTYIIDDDAIFVLILKKILCKMNHFQKVENIRNGQEAVTTLLHAIKNNLQIPDLIFLDLNMPVLDGWQFLKEIETLPIVDNLNIYIISSTIDHHEVQKARSYKCVKDFISKPIKKEDLQKIFGD